MKGVGRAVFVAVLFLIIGVLNVIYGIAAIGNAHFFDNTQFVFSSLHTWGWITVIIGIIQITAGLSLMTGGGYGRVIGIIAATIGAFESLSVGGTHPWWSLAIFALCICPCTASSSSARERRQTPSGVKSGACAQEQAPACPPHPQSSRIAGQHPSRPDRPQPGRDHALCRIGA